MVENYPTGAANDDSRPTSSMDNDVSDDVGTDVTRVESSRKTSCPGRRSNCKCTRLLVSLLTELAT